MPDAEPTDSCIPEGYAAVALSSADPVLGLGLCLLVSTKKTAGKSPLVTLRSLVDARVCLGAMVDRAGRGHQLVEVWIQRTDALGSVAPVVQPSLSNHAMDERWRRQADALRRADPASILWTGHETTHPPPCMLNLESMQTVVPRDDQDRPLALCTDDDALVKAGLPQYATSLHRYLWAGADAGELVFYPVSLDAPTTDACRPLAVAEEDHHYDVNGCAGLLGCRVFRPIDYPDYLAVLNGKSWAGVVDGRSALPIESTVGAALHDDVSGVDDDSGFGRMFLGRHGRRGRIIETFHLKLRCLADAVEGLSRQTRVTQTPHLRVSDQSFRVNLAQSGVGMPFLWGNRVELVEPADAIRLKIGDPGAALFQPLTPQGTSIYRPALASDRRDGQTLVRIRRVEKLDAKHDNPDPNDTATTVRVEATVRLGEGLDLARRDLVWLRVRPDEQAIDLYGHAEDDSALAPGEMRFFSTPFAASPKVLNTLTQAEGVSLPECAFKVLPSMSSPCDLYAMGVVGVQTMLVNRDSKLPETLDELLSLGRWTARQEEDRPLVERIAKAFDEDARWAKLLGPQRISDQVESIEQAFDLIPRTLWWQTLAMLLRMFPGASHESTCRDYSDARPDSLHKVYQPTVDALHQLIVHTRGLIVIDWHYNREVHEILRTIRSGDTAAP
ncbi:hypothetical protein OT109_15565 [Phycisphaeraceae bacterium D3-23]